MSPARLAVRYSPNGAGVSMVIITVAGDPWWVQVGLIVGSLASVLIAALGLVAWRQGRVALAVARRARQDTMRPAVVPTLMQWTASAAPPDLRQLRVHVRNDGAGAAVNFFMRIQFDGQESGWGPSVVPRGGVMDWAIAQGAEWERAYREDGAEFELFYDDVFGNRYKTSARWASAIETGFSGGFFEDVLMTEIAPGQPRPALTRGDQHSKTHTADN